MQWISRADWSIASRPHRAHARACRCRCNAQQTALSRARLPHRLELRLLGFNVAFAPVLDLRTPASAEVMRTRVVASDPEASSPTPKPSSPVSARQERSAAENTFPAWAAERSIHTTPRPPSTARGSSSGKKTCFHIASCIARCPSSWSRTLPIRRPSASPIQSPSPHPSRPFGSTAPSGTSSASAASSSPTTWRWAASCTHAPMEEAAIAAIAAGTHLIEICKDPALVLTAYEAILKRGRAISRSFRILVEHSAATVRTHRQKLLRHVRSSLPPRQQRSPRLREAVLAFTAGVPAKTPQASAVSSPARKQEIDARRRHHERHIGRWH